MKHIILSAIFCFTVLFFATPTSAGPLDVPDDSYASQPQLGL